MLSVLQSAQLCAEIYRMNRADWLPGHYWEFGDVVCAHRKVGDDDTLTFCGSKVAMDWIRDAEGWPAWDAELGFCHAGFLRYMDAVLAEVQGVLTGPITVQGHSLGGGRARIAAAKMACRKWNVRRVCVFGSPKPGFANIGRILQKGGVEHASFRNRNDPVPLVPAVIPQWQHPEQWLTFDEHADEGDLTPFRDHHMSLYIRGAEKFVAPVPVAA